MRTRSRASTPFSPIRDPSGASGALATLILLFLIFAMVLLASTTIKDPILPVADLLGHFRAWGAENKISDIESADPGVSITTPANDDIYYYDEPVGIAGRAVPDEGRKTAMVLYRVNEGDWLKARVANDTWAGLVAQYPEGSYRIEAVAYDDNGSTSAPAQVHFISLIRYVPGARYIDSDIPPQMTAGERYSCHITYENSGNLEWNNSGGYTLSPYLSNAFGAGQCPMPGTGVPPGSRVSFEISLTAPLTPGDYEVSYRIQGGGYGWFGDETHKDVNVIAAPTPTPEPTLQPTVPPYDAYVAYGHFIMINRDGDQIWGGIWRWCYDGPLVRHNQRSSYFNEPWNSNPDWDIGGPNGRYTIYSDYYDGSGSFDMNYGGSRGTITFYER